MVDIVEVQNLLARMIAGENFSITVAKTSTAAFDLKKRVLILPEWNGVNEMVGEYMRAHEVGHAKWTPLEGWHSASLTPTNPRIDNLSLYRNCLNIIEDVRIERLIKKMLPGYSKLMPEAAKIAFKEFFLENSFASLDAYVADFPNHNPGDRINFVAKVDDWHEKLPAVDAKILNSAMLAETWDEVLVVVEELYFHIVADVEKAKQRQNASAEEGDSGNEDQDELPGEDSANEEKERGDSPDGDSGNGDKDESESSDGDSDNGMGEQADSLDGDSAKKDQSESSDSDSSSGKKGGGRDPYEMLTTKALEKYDNLCSSEASSTTIMAPIKLTCAPTIETTLEFLEYLSL